LIHKKIYLLLLGFNSLLDDKLDPSVQDKDQPHLVVLNPKFQIPSTKQISITKFQTSKLSGLRVVILNLFGICDLDFGI